MALSFLMQSALLPHPSLATRRACLRSPQASNLITIWMGMAVGTLILSFLEFSMGSLAAVSGWTAGAPSRPASRPSQLQGGSAAAQQRPAFAAAASPQHSPACPCLLLKKAAWPSASASVRLA